MKIGTDGVLLGAWTPLINNPYNLLDIGAGTGILSLMLTQRSNLEQIDAIEIDEGARDVAQGRLGKPILTAPLPGLDGIEDGTYDIVALLDVLEHIVEDEASLASIRTKLKPGGRILLTVPANPWMWSAHDTAHHHHRRYTIDSLKAVATKAGLKVHLMSHFNSLLFPVAAVARLIGKAMGKQTSDDQMPSASVNTILTRIFGLETHLVGRVPLPMGVSIVAILS